MFQVLFLLDISLFKLQHALLLERNILLELLQVTRERAKRLIEERMLQILLPVIIQNRQLFNLLIVSNFRHIPRCLNLVVETDVLVNMVLLSVEFGLVFAKVISAVRARQVHRVRFLVTERVLLHRETVDVAVLHFGRGFLVLRINSRGSEGCIGGELRVVTPDVAISASVALFIRRRFRRLLR